MMDTSIKLRELSFFNDLNISEKTQRVYKQALKSSFLKGFLSEKFGYKSIFEISDLDILSKIYSALNIHPKNISNHRCYSAAVMKYIRYLNGGKKNIRRIDYGAKRKKV